MGRLLNIIAAQRAIISWYEEEINRSCYDDSQIPEDLLALEQSLEAAEQTEG